MYTIGEFARLGGVSIRMLRHYDGLGLLPPALVDPDTGYRSYRASQLARLNRIVALRDVGFGLQQIGRLLDDVTVEELRGMLALRRAQLEDDLAEGSARLRGVDARLRTIEQEDTMPDDVSIKPLPQQCVAAIGRRADGFGPENLAPILSPAYLDLEACLAGSHVAPIGPRFAFYTGDSETNDLFAFAARPVDEGVIRIQPPAEVYILDAIPRAASVVREGTLEEIYSNLYSDLGRWIEENGFEHVGSGRDVLLEDSEDPGAVIVVEVQWPIRRPDEPPPDVTPKRVGRDDPLRRP
jgi:DNA-binding transcriptional MerR regulator